MNVSVSVIVPVYNSQDTIAACIESILGQTFTNFELILVDDGSYDNSGSICDTYSAKNPLLKVLHQANKGRAAARSAGLAVAVGEWVTFVDSDDKLPSNALALLMQKATDEVDIVHGNGYALPGVTNEQVTIDAFRHMAVRADGMIGVPWGSLYRRIAIPSSAFDLPREMINGEDYIFWLRMVFSTSRNVNIVNDSVYIKGDDHTCNSFIWTAEYCNVLHRYRLSSIPQAMHMVFMHDMITDRLANLSAVAVTFKRSKWENSSFYRDIISDILCSGYRMPLRQRLFFMLPSLRLRKLYSTLSRLRAKFGSCLNL